MVAYITGIYVLILAICQLTAAKIVDSAEIDIQRDSLTQMTAFPEGGTSRNQHNVKRIPKQPQPARNCEDGISCNGEFIATPNIGKPCVGSLPCENGVRSKAFKESLHRRRRKVSPVALSSSLKKMPGVLVLTSQCPPLRCARGKEPRLKRTKSKTARLGGTLRASKECRYGSCLENDKVGMNTKESLENDEKNKAINDDTSTTLTLDCPIGLWCATQQKRDYENSVTLEQCPPGLWCKRNGIKTTEDQLTKRENKGDKRCPDGFLCSSKREVGHKNFESLNQCPPGLWCKRDEIKSEDNSKETSINQVSCPHGFMCSSKREVGFEKSSTLSQCPPGLWCKRDTISTKDDITESHGIEKYCPNGLKCSSKRLVDDDKSENVYQCPPGLWCKRNSPKDYSTLKEVGSIERKKDRDCPYGPWCALKRDLASTPRRILPLCASGTWCSHSMAEIQHASSEGGDDEPY